MKETNTGALRSQLDSKIWLWPILILRIMLGLNMMSTAWFWVTVEDRGASLISQMTPRLESGQTVSIYEPFVSSFVFEHVELFATLVTLGESFVAVSLLLGLATRLGAGVGMFLMANYALGWGNSFLIPTGNWMWFWQFAVVFLAPPGRILGVDVWLRREWPRVPLW